MASFFETGQAVDLILGIMLVEILVLAVYQRRTGRGIPPIDLLLNNLAGACLLMALRASLTGAAWLAIAPWLIAAFTAHIADLARRWR